MTLVHIITGDISPASHSVQRNAGIHAGSTGLTGLTGVGRAHEHMACFEYFPLHELSECTSRESNTTLTLLTMIKASIHAGFGVTGIADETDNPRKSRTVCAVASSAHAQLEQTTRAEASR